MEPICPECEQGKHQNCDATAYDNEHDVFVRCYCEITSHQVQFVALEDA